MTSKFVPSHPQELFTPGWHAEAKSPVVEGRYYDTTTGELHTSTKHDEYAGPPAVDIIISSQHIATSHCRYRAALPFPMETLLHQVMKVVHDRNLEIDSLTATKYAIRIMITHELTVDEFYDAAMKMTQGIWDQK